MSQDWDRAEPTPDVVSDDKVLLDEAVARIVQLNGGRTSGHVLPGLMRWYWAGELPLFKLRPAPGHTADSHCNFRRGTRRSRAEHAHIQRVGIRELRNLRAIPECHIPHDDDEEGPVVDECVRFDWPREKLLHLLQRSELSAVDTGVRPDLAGFRAVARMAPTRAYGPGFECLADLRTYASNLAAWCQQEGLTTPAEWKAGGASGPEPHGSGAPGRPTAMHLVEQELARRVVSGETWASKAACARDLAAWLRGTYPEAPRLTGKTILNRLRQSMPIARN